MKPNTVETYTSKEAKQLDGSASPFSFFPYTVTHSHCVTTIGNFDGCHLGHQALIRNNLRLGDELACPNIALTFDPHPQHFFHPVADPKELLTPERKTRALRELGVTTHYILKFNSELNHTDHEIFYERFLRATLKVRALTIGDDFRFGHLRKGDAQWLSAHGPKDGIRVDIIQPVMFEDQAVSSTRIRKALTESGNVDLAKHLLSRPYSLEGTLVKGEQIGRKLGFPTLNLDAQHQIVPSDGVYCGYVWIEGLSPQPQAPVMKVDSQKLFPAVFSIGTRPTFETKENKLCIEAHVLNELPQGRELYGVKSAFYFEKRLRGMIAFKSIEELKQQMAKDVKIAMTSL